MELKETKHLPNSAEINVVNPSERNNSKDRGIYNILFTPAEEETDTSIDNKYTSNIDQKLIYSNVSTLDWLKTWRSTTIS